MHPLVVTQLFIYPVKSLGGLSLQRSMVYSKGLADDRRWMLVDEGHCFMTQRQVPALALFRISVGELGKGLLVEYESDIQAISKEPLGDSFKAIIWNDVVDVVEVAPGLSQWFSEKLGRTCRLVYFPESNNRPVDPEFATGPSDQTSLSDGYPILFIGQSSLDDLNSRLAKPVGMDRFRPNIVFAGGTSFEEDSWGRIIVGEVPMRVVKPCARCVMTTVDQQTATVGKEPLATLSTFRKVGNKVLFGQNVIPVQEGMISVGDEIRAGI